MPAYTINVIDRLGSRRELREQAMDEAMLRESLRTRGLWPMRIAEAQPERRLARLRMPTRDFVALLHQLELQVKAGITADVALGQLAEDAPAGTQRTMLEKIHREVSQGQSIHAACAFFGRQFPPHVAAIIAAGEASAQLPATLQALADHVSRVDTLRRTAKRALVYPVIVLGATTLLVGFMLAGVVPQFAAIFDSLHLALPWPTRILIATSGVVRHAWLGASLAAFVVVISAIVSLRAKHGRALRDRAVLWVPAMGDTVRHLATARFAAHVRLLHDAGISLLEALATGADLTGNAVLATEVRAARNGVAQGQPLYAALPKHHHFPRFMVAALKSGETSGQLGAALQHIEVYASAVAQEKLALLLALLEPMLIALLTSIVGFIALSFFLPLFQLMGGIR